MVPIYSIPRVALHAHIDLASANLGSAASLPCPAGVNCQPVHTSDTQTFHASSIIITHNSSKYHPSLSPQKQIATREHTSLEPIFVS